MVLTSSLCFLCRTQSACKSLLAMNIILFQAMVLALQKKKKEAWFHKHASLHQSLACDTVCEILKA